MLTRRNLLLGVVGMMTMAAGWGPLNQAQAQSPNSLKTKIVLLENKPTYVKFKLVGDAKLGPLNAHVESDPIVVNKSQSKTVDLMVAGVFFRIRATCSANKLEVKTDAWVFVAGQKLSMSETKSVQIN